LFTLFTLWWIAGHWILDDQLFGLLVKRVLTTETAVFLQLQTIGCRPLILCCGIVASLAIRTRQCHDVSHVNSHISGDRRHEKV